MAAAEAIFLQCTVHFSVTISIFYASLDAMIHSETFYIYTEQLQQSLAVLQYNVPYIICSCPLVNKLLVKKGRIIIIMNLGIELVVITG